MTGAKRIFWLGAHKVLKRTELRYLRENGYEVFNPPYISPVYDQSMDLRVDRDQPTSLPAEVFETLLGHDFFYTAVPPTIAELLNSHFDTVIVTINADWLSSILAAFDGRIIYRVYGQPYSLSEHLVSIGAWAKIVARDGFVIVPFADESVAREHRWFLDLCAESVPYQISDDVFERTGQWSRESKKQEIATSIPNIENPYYRAAYESFAARYPQRIFRIYGPQRSIPDDNRIVGNLERSVLLDAFARSSGYLYPYTDSVCYLPPIESMQIGVPVVYAPGSLLSRFYGEATPGLILDEHDAETKLRRLIRRDWVFTEEVIAAQEGVRLRYDRSHVRPIFDRVFASLLDGQLPPRGLDYTPPVLRGPAAPASRAGKAICIFLHFDGLFAHLNGRVYAFEGIPRVVDIVIEALIRFSDYRIVVTCTTQSLPVMLDFLRDDIRSGRVTLHAAPCGNGLPEADRQLARLELIEQLNADDSIALTIVPHYYLFPECLLLRSELALYLPDYFPHVMPGVVFDGSAEQDSENKQVGVAIARKSRFILTNSHYTKAYLPDAGFVEAGQIDKVIVAPLPLLGGTRGDALTPAEERAITDRLGGRRFLLYPTANRPNKQMAFLLRVFAITRARYPDLVLVLTCDLNSVPGVNEAADQYGVRDHLLMLSRVDDGTLRWLYQHAAALCLTTTLEGNFPPQVLEALTYDTPVVATRLVQMTEILGDLASRLLLCNPRDLDDFVANLSVAIEDRKAVVERQREVIDFLKQRNSLENFYRAFSAGLPSQTDAAGTSN